MTLRRFFIVATVGVFVATATCLILCLPKPEADTRAAFTKIRPGMTRTAVHALLGGLPQSQTVTKGRVVDAESFITNSDPGVQARDGHRRYTFCEWVIPHWRSTSYVAVVFDGDVVVCRYLTEAPPGFWDTIRMRLERLL